jgi:hypothetical protein
VRVEGLESFLGEEHLRRLEGLAVDADVGHLVKPVACRRIERRRVRQLQAIKEVLFDGANAVIDAPCFLRLTDATRPDLEAVMVGEVQVTWRKVDDPRSPAQ